MTTRPLLHPDTAKGEHPFNYHALGQIAEMATVRPILCTIAHVTDAAAPRTFEHGRLTATHCDDGIIFQHPGLATGELFVPVHAAVNPPGVMNVIFQ